MYIQVNPKRRLSGSGIFRLTESESPPLAIMSAELYEHFAANNRIDQAIYEAEEDFAKTGEAVDAKIAFSELEKKYFG